MANCRSCDAEIFWVTTVNGKKMPIDAEQVEVKNEGDRTIYLFERDGMNVPIEPGATGVGHYSHFATCEFADSHRKK